MARRSVVLQMRALHCWTGLSFARHMSRWRAAAARRSGSTRLLLLGASRFVSSSAARAFGSLRANARAIAASRRMARPKLRRAFARWLSAWILQLAEACPPPHPELAPAFPRLRADDEIATDGPATRQPSGVRAPPPTPTKARVSIGGDGAVELLPLGTPRGVSPRDLDRLSRPRTLMLGTGGEVEGEEEEGEEEERRRRRRRRRRERRRRERRRRRRRRRRRGGEGGGGGGGGGVRAGGDGGTASEASMGMARVAWMEAPARHSRRPRRSRCGERREGGGSRRSGGREAVSALAARLEQKEAWTP